MQRAWVPRNAAPRAQRGAWQAPPGCPCTHKLCPHSPACSSGLKVRARVHEQHNENLISYGIICFIPESSALHLHHKKHPCKAEVTQALISQHGTNRTLGWLVAIEHDLRFIWLPSPQHSFCFPLHSATSGFTKLVGGNYFQDHTLCESWFKFPIRFKNYFVKMMGSKS